LLWSSGTKNPGSFQAEGTKKAAVNPHPTVKPIALMRYLCKLITPPGGTVLDPFTGSGSTGCAAVQEGFNFIGIEKESEYAEIARRRIAYWSQPEEKNGKPKADSTRPEPIDTLFAI
jgi:site-specific DNA-methyltransferase (adenine-specific)